MPPTRLSRFVVLSSLVLAFWLVPTAAGDGGFFHLLLDETEAANLAQTRQEAIVVIDDGRYTQDPVPKVTYVLRTRYTGAPETFAWVIPTPATPTDVVAYEDGAFFDEIDQFTKPRFRILEWRSSEGLSCVCVPVPAAPGQGTLVTEETLVTVEAEGEAGVFAWAALTSTGSDALLTWLDDNGFAIPEEANEILDAYIEEGWHFLALRVREPEDIAANELGEFEIPPIQFTCQTSERIYPMRISRVSAAEETEVLLYTFAPYDVKSANLGNRTFGENEITYDSSSPSLTTYESKFREIVEAYPDGVLLKEYQDYFPPVPAALLEAQPWIERLYLTRLRTVLRPDQMDQDIEFEEGPGGYVPHTFDVYVDAGADKASVFGLPLGGLALFACCGWGMKRLARWLDKKRC